MCKHTKPNKKVPPKVPAVIKVDGTYFDYNFTWGKIYYDSATCEVHTEPNSPAGIQRLQEFKVGKEMVNQRKPEEAMGWDYGY